MDVFCDSDGMVISPKNCSPMTTVRKLTVNSSSESSFSTTHTSASPTRSQSGGGGGGGSIMISRGKAKTATDTTSALSTTTGFSACLDLPLDSTAATATNTSSTNAIPGSATHSNHLERKVWVPHATMGYVPGTITGKEGDLVEVTADDYGELVVQIKESELQYIHSTSLAGVDDFLELGEFSLGALLNSIRVRHACQKVYTSIGAPILISVNPYCNVPRLYSAEEAQRYRNGATGPHLYRVGHIALSTLDRTMCPQSIVITGESGAGKTEATKILLRFFSEDGFTDPYKVSVLKVPSLAPRKECTPQRRIQDLVLRSNPILEAFGNAQTLRNDNSSRFGKFIKLYFLPSDCRRIHSASIKHCLLEKCRLTSIQGGERSFHIFYQLLAAYRDQNALIRLTTTDSDLEGSQIPEGEEGGYCAKPLMDSPWRGGEIRRRAVIELESSPEVISAVSSVWPLLQLDKVQFKRIRDTDIREQDRADFWGVIKCLHVSDFGNEHIQEILRIIAALLHLGCVEFSPVVVGQGGGRESGNSSRRVYPSAGIANDVYLRIASELLGVTVGEDLLEEGVPMYPVDKIQDLRGLLLFRQRRENLRNYITSPEEVFGARMRLEALIKTLYVELFEYLVSNINASLVQSGDLEQDGREASSMWIGLLDIYGFEKFENKNSFEQLCINYANEKLQQHFTQHVLCEEQRIYETEGISWRHIDYSRANNLKIIAALEDKTGVLSLFDDVCVAQMGTDNSFLEELHKSSSSSSAGGVASSQEMIVKRNVRNPKACFDVCHYAGEVTYDVTGFKLKNTDMPDASFLSFFATHSTLKVFQSAHFQKYDDAYQTLQPGKLTETVYRSFKKQLKELMDALEATNPCYVRCIKPNSVKSATEFDSSDVLRQLKCAGLLEAIKIRNFGYAHRLTMKEFLDLFGIVGNMTPSSLRNTPNSKELVVRVLNSVIASYQCDGEDLFQIGKERVFLKDKLMKYLDAERSRVLMRSVLCVQRAVRRWTVKHAINYQIYLYDLWKAVTSTQRKYRKLVLVKILMRLLNAVTERAERKLLEEKRRQEELRCREELEKERLLLLEAKKHREKQYIAVRQPPLSRMASTKSQVSCMYPVFAPRPIHNREDYSMRQLVVLSFSLLTKLNCGWRPLWCLKHQQIWNDPMVAGRRILTPYKKAMRTLHHEIEGFMLDYSVPSVGAHKIMELAKNSYGFARAYRNVLEKTIPEKSMALCECWEYNNELYFTENVAILDSITKLMSMSHPHCHGETMTTPTHSHNVRDLTEELYQVQQSAPSRPPDPPLALLSPRTNRETDDHFTAQVMELSLSLLTILHSRWIPLWCVSHERIWNNPNVAGRQTLALYKKAMRALYHEIEDYLSLLEYSALHKIVELAKNSAELLQKFKTALDKTMPEKNKTSCGCWDSNKDLYLTNSTWILSKIIQLFSTQSSHCYEGMMATTCTARGLPEKPCGPVSPQTIRELTKLSYCLLTRLNCRWDPRWCLSHRRIWDGRTVAGRLTLAPYKKATRTLHYGMQAFIKNHYVLSSSSGTPNKMMDPITDSARNCMELARVYKNALEITISQPTEPPCACHSEGEHKKKLCFTDNVAVLDQIVNLFNTLSHGCCRGSSLEPTIATNNVLDFPEKMYQQIQVRPPRLDIHRCPPPHEPAFQTCRDY